jgi:hypothetical protein
MATNLKSSWLAGPVSCNLLENNILDANLLEAHLLENRCLRPLSLKLLKVNPYFWRSLRCFWSDCGLGGLPMASIFRLLGGTCQLRGPGGRLKHATMSKVVKQSVCGESDETAIRNNTESVQQSNHNSRCPCFTAS